MYAIKRDVMCLIGSYESCMQKLKSFQLNRWESHCPDIVISFKSLFQYRQMDIAAYRDTMFNQKRCPMVHWIKEKLYEKESRSWLKKRWESYMPVEQFSRQTDIHTLWLIEVLYVIKRDHLGLLYPSNIACKKSRA